MADSGFGQQDPSDSAGPFNAQVFVIAQMISKVSTMKIVQVKAVDTGAKTVDVQPMVNMLDGDNQSSPHGTIAGIPYWQWQFGKNAIEADPVVGDIGIMVCADRDSSSVIAAKAIANPGSARTHDAQDGVYMGGILNGIPDQWIKFTDDGIEISAKGSHKLYSTSAAGWTVDQMTVTGNLLLGGNVLSQTGVTYAGNFHTTGTITGDTDVIAAGKSGASHVHSYIRPSSGGTGANTGAPT
jgi:hypothetical protein